MRHINHCNTLQDRAVPTDGSFGIPYFMKTRMTGSGTERKGKRGIYSHWQTGNYRAKLANASFRTARSSLAVSEKIILAGGLRYFSRKPCLSGSVCRKAHVVQRTAKARVSTIKMIKS